MITVYSSDWCPFCTNAKRLLDHKGVKYTEIKVDNQPRIRAQMIELSGRTSVPQIFIDEKHIGGCDDLYALEREGQLDTLISQQD
ncbi:glutaredoxin 3 [Neptunomonas sp.]|uniref:glutaredoxin 3 n=1 Tax=Neptunomonas sp. TaxID=1971898 RepID=UPI0025E3F6EB|nr:glutaredoxin 3 [Neptunomonas sp.]